VKGPFFRVFRSLQSKIFRTAKLVSFKLVWRNVLLWPRHIGPRKRQFLCKISYTASEDSTPNIKYSIESNLQEVILSCKKRLLCVFCERNFMVKELMVRVHERAQMARTLESSKMSALAGCVIRGSSLTRGLMGLSLGLQTALHLCVLKKFKFEHFSLCVE
jgi:hypothetical protein